MTGAARGVWAGVLASLLLISPAEAEAEPEAAPFPPLPAGRPACCTQRGQSAGGGGGVERHGAEDLNLQHNQTLVHQSVRRQTKTHTDKKKERKQHVEKTMNQEADETI